MEEHNSISEVRIAPFPQHSPPAPSCQGLSYNFSEPFYEEMNQEHQEYYGRAAAKATSVNPSPSSTESSCCCVSLLLLPAATRAALGMLCCHSGLRYSGCGQKKHQLKDLTFAQKEKTLPLLEADSYSGCVHRSWPRAGL